jgi:hypothetical protein
MAKYDLAQLVEKVLSQDANRWHHEHEQRLEYLVAEAVAARANNVLFDSVKSLTQKTRAILWDPTWKTWFIGAVASSVCAWVLAILPLGWISALSILPFGFAAYCTRILWQCLNKQRVAILQASDDADNKLPRPHASSA